MKLYKYRKFSEFLIKELCSSEIYFSDPSCFNDPLDCSPIIENDLNIKELEYLCYMMLCKNKGKIAAKENIERFKYYATEYEGQYEKSLSFQLLYEIKNQLDLVMKNIGVLSLSRKNDSPLMWSHYANEHKGVCLEFDIETAARKPKEIDYKGTRGISAKLIQEYICSDSAQARELIEKQYFFTKASEWSYESEWRLLSKSYGSKSAPFYLTGIYFGMRCDTWIVASIIKLLHNENSNVKFYRMHADSSSFNLNVEVLEAQEWVSCIPRPSAVMAFSEYRR
ncbi:DUF2971 domain-containing protein [Aliivibrio fischeri]|uniref:DUF2971 domain-containing protein n=2 Tax=Aliivibrio TaxID=511678 RepID=UPI00114691ED|nr:DUF2971 domain-containing protein [Aliivibrio fischeri]USR97025.1 DUF2971 domain-containing protein [Aliivibrio fischeri ATCC 7744 = JCM 18803 = DSM 507]GGK51228.1 hypothetical protein GCM10007987_37760 [Aliivibrio fischeri]